MLLTPQSDYIWYQCLCNIGVEIHQLQNSAIIVFDWHFSY
jgi:aromatic ring-opening dioxygenase catalytic subunit (LigB family)